MSKQQGQLPAENKDSTKLYRLTLNKEELKAVHTALQIDFETLSELLNDDPEWEHIHAVADKVLAKISKLGAERE